MFFGEGLSYNKKNCWREPGMSDDVCFHLQTFCGSLFARAGSRLSSGFLLPGISLGCTRTHVCVCELVLVQAHTACLQRRARATRRPARRWYRHGAAGWAALGADDGLALTTCLQSALWRTWRHKWIETVQSIIITGSRQQAGRQAGRFGCLGLADACRKRAPASI
jgi:hypothetical protein